MKCNHIIRHPQTEEEREEIKTALHGARLLGDNQSITLYIAMLTQECKPTETAAERDNRMMADREANRYEKFLDGMAP